VTDPKSHILIIEARFYGDLADEMAAGAIATLDRAGASHERIAVPGTFEIPAAIGFAAKSGLFDGYVALGCVIRGETTHYDYICQESARALQDFATVDGLAIGYGILTCENRDQAWVRADREQGDKGRAAVDACLAMLDLRRRFVAS
jgi:6,7-dimethyl-8-ribityllumazine synthase